MEVKKKEKKFAEGYCFKKIFIFFLIGCLIGTYYEEILYFVRTHNWESRDGLIYGPFSPIYGLGVSIFVIFLGKNNDKRNVFKTWFYSALIGGVTEYLTSFIAEYIFGVQFWDYSNKFLNIMGRTTIPYMIFWGIGGLILMKVIYPLVSYLLEKIPIKIGNVLYYIIFIFIIIDLVITYSALGRMAFRDNNIKPFTFVGELYDKVYPDEFLYKKFPIMKKS